LLTLKEKILARQNGLLFFSFAPPKITTEESQLLAIVERQIDRIGELDVDGLILYDIKDESERTAEKRTFPFIPTIAPEDYVKHHLSRLQTPKIIYKSIANHTLEMFVDWLQENNDLEHVVFVGASSNKQIHQTGFSLADAYELRRKHFADVLLGGVTIPERHSKKGDEHKRIFGKMQKGCSFFVSQCVYNVHDTKNLLSDYYYDSVDNGYSMSPTLFTLSPCGSLKTLEFMKWLGIEVPTWLYNELKHSRDILDASIKMSLQIAEEIFEFAGSKQIPIGFNVESISNKKDEIAATIEILNGLSKLVANVRTPKVQVNALQTGKLNGVEL
jgi:5,10-methylenetetrahydrofolate reductase